MDGGRPMSAARDPVVTRIHAQYRRPSVRFQGHPQVQNRDVTEDTEGLGEIPEQPVLVTRVWNVMVRASMAFVCYVIEQLYRNNVCGAVSDKK